VFVTSDACVWQAPTPRTAPEAKITAIRIVVFMVCLLKCFSECWLLRGRCPTTQYRLSEVIHRLAGGPEGLPGGQPVNNFAANRAATVSDWPFGFIFGIGSLWLPAPAGQAC
jgi:hypothetical protein